ncbi:hypothetical protein [Thiolapillus sp.]
MTDHCNRLVSRHWLAAFFAAVFMVVQLVAAFHHHPASSTQDETCPLCLLQSDGSAGFAPPALHVKVPCLLVLAAPAIVFRGYEPPQAVVAVARSPPGTFS